MNTRDIRPAGNQMKSSLISFLSMLKTLALLILPLVPEGDRDKMHGRFQDRKRNIGQIHKLLGSPNSSGFQEDASKTFHKAGSDRSNRLDRDAHITGWRCTR
jgi:hypothetical protein